MGTRQRVANLTGKYLDCRIHGIDISSEVSPFHPSLMDRTEKAEKCRKKRASCRETTVGIFTLRFARLLKTRRIRVLRCTR